MLKEVEFLVRTGVKSLSDKVPVWFVLQTNQPETFLLILLSRILNDFEETIFEWILIKVFMIYIVIFFLL